MIAILNNELNMTKQYRIVLLISYLNFLNAASISMKSLTSSLPTIKPLTLVLPPGFDSQSPPLQPMLYPFAVSLSAETTRAPLKHLPIITPGWIPMSKQTKGDLPLIPTSFSTSTSTRNPIPLAALGHRISQYDIPNSSLSFSYNKDSPVFESIVYGTWKPDPPLQPPVILDSTKQQQQHISSSGRNSGLVIDGKVYNKTINRQHGGFIGNIQQKPVKVEKQNVLQNNNEKSSSSSIEYRSNESIELRVAQKPRKVKKQGRQKIRINPTTQQSEATTLPPLSTIESSYANTDQTTETQTQQTVINVNKGDPKLMEVVKQMSDSVDIKYNHKQTSPHSIEMMTTPENDNEDEQRWHTHTNMPKTVTASSTELQQQQQHQQQNENELENTSVARMNWPTDFMNTPLTLTSPTTIMQQQSLSEYSTSSSVDTETESSELPLALGALNIPPSLWPKLPGNITKFGSPYEAENSAEEPALCIPITVREHNMMNSNEIVHIERIFCFPMPNSTSREFLKDKSSTLSTVTKAKVQNFNDFVDIHVKNDSNNLRSQFYLLTCILVVYFNFIY